MIKEILTGNVEEFMQNIHDLASLNTRGNEWSVEALMESIKEIGQQEPILIYRGKVVDGRNRLGALRSLRIDEVLYENLPNNMSLDQVALRVLATDTGKDETKTQKAIKAYRLWKDRGMKIDSAAKHSKVSVDLVKKVGTLLKLSNKQKIQDLFEGKFHQRMSDENGVVKATDSIPTIIADLKARGTNSVDIDNMDYGSSEGAGRNLSGEEIVFNLMKEKEVLRTKNEALKIDNEELALRVQELEGRKKTGYVYYSIMPEPTEEIS